MAFCKNCGQQIDNSANVCPNCGTPVNAAPPQAPVQPQVVDPNAPQPGEKGLAWLAYVLWGPAFLIPLFVKKTSAYCRFHVKQGATLWAVHITYYILQSIITGIFTGIYLASYYNTGLLILKNSISTILWAGNIFLIVLAIIGIVNAATGKMKELPLISKIPFVATLIDKIYAAINK